MPRRGFFSSRFARWRLRYICQVSVLERTRWLGFCDAVCHPNKHAPKAANCSESEEHFDDDGCHGRRTAIYDVFFEVLRVLKASAIVAGGDRAQTLQEAWKFGGRCRMRKPGEKARKNAHNN